MNNCLECNCTISEQVHDFSNRKYGISLCIPHQQWLEDVEKISTWQTITLYFALKTRGVPAELEKFDGFKHIDIAITDARVNLEIDGGHHNYDTKQAMADLKRTYYSFLKGFLTLRIPNSLICNNDIIEETADFIVKFLNENNRKDYVQRKQRGTYYKLRKDY
ncbi:hypothetical protein M2451_002011 [Dysgonomonas sp. PFB1-18]|uniref:hypothetical protein n=1 Tax=unclassified Dysgonomonas TaxID=2630389 RepID=UPI00247359F2|nr:MULTISPECIES: hypothetical protein [unclassified Dysgonomonas]MDH6309805.1 hypothetical protein [Dysgonomonas sp. PF1-14]MDH6339187.1 hypothetical protein [Dysgonomonas sp. PF1-16]MDH6380686.1 hypothetical protein [Dysgonomonas sp. PFB1-18]MDH6398182.1 hypothetical protein [Dysgonomonas sp. PF1-23]